MDNEIIEQLSEEAKDVLIHWAKTYKGYFMMKDALEKYFEATGANRSCGNSNNSIGQTHCCPTNCYLCYPFTQQI